MLSIGWNGMPAGFENECEHWEDVIDYFEWEDADRKLVTKPEVIHAERNAIDKMTRQGIPTEGSLRSEEHTSELQSRGHLVCRLLLEKKKQTQTPPHAGRRPDR